MDEPTTAYPLTWPSARPRTPASQRERARFGRKVSKRSSHSDYSWTSKHELSMGDAVTRLLGELGRLGVGTEPIVSTNVAVRLDGRPRSNQRRPADPGAAVYFRWRGAPYVMACDKWDRPEDNVAAVAAHIGALRGMERWGVVDQAEAFAGFKALPAVGESSVARPAWWTVLELSPDTSAVFVDKQFRRLAQTHHPDKGGDPRAWEELCWARDAGHQALGAS